MPWSIETYNMIGFPGWNSELPGIYVEYIVRYIQTFVPRKIGVWVLGWVLYPNPKPKPKTQKFLYPNQKPKPKTQTFLYPCPKPKPETQKWLYPNPKPKPKNFLATNVWKHYILIILISSYQKKVTHESNIQLSLKWNIMLHINLTKFSLHQKRKAFNFNLILPQTKATYYPYRKVRE